MSIPPLHKERPRNPGPLPTPKNILLIPSIPPSWISLFLNVQYSGFWGPSQAFRLAYWVQHFNWLPFLLFDIFFLFNDFQGLLWHPDYVRAGAGINDASSFTAQKENIQNEFIPFFYSSMQRLEENDVKVFYFSLSATWGEFAKGKAFF